MPPRPVQRGLFFTFEGIEGAGKTSHARRLAQTLKKKGLKVVLTREPGGTHLGREIRRLLLSPRLSPTPRAELYLYLAERAQHVEETIRPALLEGSIVISDRYADGSVAYQGAARGLGVGWVRELSDWASGGLQPDLTFLLDAPVEVGLDRVRARGRDRDRLEREALSFHRRVRRGYLEIAAHAPERIRLIRTDGPREDVAARVLRAAVPLLAIRYGRGPWS